MKITDIPVESTHWATIAPVRHHGESGYADWHTRQFGDLRVRMVHYSQGYLADHWCSKGHVLLCVAGSLDTELEDGRTFALNAGMSYQVADDAEPHRSRTDTGATLLIVD